MNNPLAEVAEPVGEYPDVPARSGAAALMDAANEQGTRYRNLQNAIGDVRTWCHGKHLVGAREILNIIESHHV